MIICAAIKDNQTGAVFGGIRHGDIYSAMHDANITRKCSEVTEGFLDSKNNFLDRYEAYKAAIACGQLSVSTRELKRKNFEAELYSEDLY